MKQIYLEDNSGSQRNQENNISAILSNDPSIGALENLYTLFKEAMADRELEIEWQKFIETNFDIILQGYRRAIPKLNISIGKTKFPDFLLITHNNELVILEIKKPSTALIRRTGKNYHFSNDVVKATSQLESYIDDIHKHADAISNYLAKEHLISLNAVTSRGILLAGDTRKLSLVEKERFSLLSRGYKNISFKTYDELLNMLRQNIDALKNLPR